MEAVTVPAPQADLMGARGQLFGVGGHTPAEYILAQI